MAKPVSIYNEITNLNYSLLLFGGNLPKTNAMLRRQSERHIHSPKKDAMALCRWCQFSSWIPLSYTLV